MTDLEKKIRFVVDTLHDREHEVSLQNVWSSLHTIYGDKVRGKITRDEVNQILIRPKKKKKPAKKEEAIIPLTKPIAIDKPNALSNDTSNKSKEKGLT